MRLQRASPPGFQWLGERLVEATDRAGAGSHSRQGFGHFSHGCWVLVPATNIWLSPEET